MSAVAGRRTNRVVPKGELLPELGWG
eukprot:COSAG03_NODE_19_length_21645_cov_17.937532_24_plen_25_part_01